MKIVNATPPADFPKLCIILDREIGARHPSKAFYLRVQKDNGDVDTVDLDGSVTPVDARSKARALGYEPTHWMEATDSMPMRF